MAPSMLHTELVCRTVRPEIAVAGQNCWHGPCGAFTGEVSAEQLRDCGCAWVLLGHSERRAFSHESDEYVSTKVHHALEASLGVIACVGETLAQRDFGRTLEVVDEQMRAIAANVPMWGERLVVAYEPVWSIGTGKSASPEQVQEVHAELRRWLRENVGEEAASVTRIVYGGSVSASNAPKLAALPDVDGFLVGGASLRGAEFAQIVRAGAREHAV